MDTIDGSEIEAGQKASIVRQRRWGAGAGVVVGVRIAIECSKFV